jgi:hypothetical protein
MRRILVALTAALVLSASAVAADPLDQQVANQIAKAIKENGNLKGYQINVKYREGVARLEGWVRNQQQLEEALAVVRRTPQVSQVINHLDVRDPSAKVEPVGAPIGDPVREAVRPPARQPVGEPLREVAREPLGEPIRPAAGVQPVLQRARPAESAPALVAPEDNAPAVGPQPTLVPQPATLPVASRPVRINRRFGPNNAAPVPEYVPGTGGGAAPAMYDQAAMPNYAWPSYAAYPNYGAVTYPKQYSPTAWPYIGPFYPYPQVPLGWRKVTLEWDDGWWFLDFSDNRRHATGR